MSFGAPLKLNIKLAGAAARAGGKRTSREAGNESASVIVPRQVERQHSILSTPNVINLVDLLTNGNQSNQK